MTNTTKIVHPSHPAPRRALRIPVPSPWLQVRGRRVSWFHVCGAAAAVSWATVLLVGADLRMLPLTPLLFISLTAAATFIVLVAATALILGEGRLTWYHHYIAVLSTTGAVIVINDWPVLAYLDVVGTALMAFSALGRVGCLLTGCCHGRPASSGLVYGSAHADAGLSPALIGVPLLPVQLAESLIAAALTSWCLLTLASPAPAGTTLGLSLAGYALARFWLETARGDRRLHAAGLSKAQWTATATAAALGLIALAGALWVPPTSALLAAAVPLSAIAYRTSATGHGSRPPQTRPGSAIPRREGKAVTPPLPLDLHLTPRHHQRQISPNPQVSSKTPPPSACPPRNGADDGRPLDPRSG